MEVDSQPAPYSSTSAGMRIIRRLNALTCAVSWRVSGEPQDVLGGKMYNKYSTSSSVFSVQAMHLRCWRLTGQHWVLYVVHDQRQDLLEIGQLEQAALLALLLFSALGDSTRETTAGGDCLVQTWCDFVSTSRTPRFGWCHDTGSKSDEWHHTYYAGFDKAHKQERPRSWLLRFDLV
jgi:hypothetical protein